MISWVGQFCLNVEDLDRSVAFYTALSLECTSRTEIPQAWEAIVQRPGYGGSFQIAQQKEQVLPIDRGNAFWKMYVNTCDVTTLHERALAAGAFEVTAPEKLDRWPVTISFVHDPDGYLVELVQRDPWPDEAPSDRPWLGQYCVNVTDLERTIAFYETLGLTCTSRTEIPHAFEAILEGDPGTVGGKIQLAQQRPVEPLQMGSAWKFYVNTDDCTAAHDRAVAAGHRSLVAPMSPERWPVTIAFVEDPDGYQIELVQRH